MERFLCQIARNALEQTDKTMNKNTEATVTAARMAEGASAGPIQPQTTHADILRKLMRGRAAPPQTAETPAAPRPVTAEKAASTAFSRAAEKLYNMPVFPQSVAIKTISLAELSELLPEQPLLAIIEGKAENLGVVALCPNTVGSLIEMQAIGHVSSRAIRPRKPTRTDAVITADFVSALLLELGKEMASRAELPDFSSFSYASFMDDIRPMLLMLEEKPMTLLSIHYGMGSNGQRTGQAIVAIPSLATARGEARDDAAALFHHAPADADQIQHPPTARSPRNETLAEVVRHAPVPLVGVLCRKTLSLAALRQLSPGDLITLPSGALDHATLETASGQLLAVGRFGEADNCHAIRLRGPVSGDGKRGPVAAIRSAGQIVPDIGAGRDIDLSQPDDFRMPANLPGREDISAAAVPDHGEPAPTPVPDRGIAERMP